MSLESYDPWFECQPLFDNQSYEELISSHEAFHKELNSRMNTFEDLFERSTEAFDIKAFGKWIVDSFTRLMQAFEALGKRILAKIVELTMRSKQGLYSKFKGAAFTALDIKINERKLHRDILANIHQSVGQYKGLLDAFIINLQFGMNGAAFDRLAFDEIPEKIMNVVTEIREKGAKSLIEPIFYQDASPSEISIAEYFDCKIGQVPKQIELLSDAVTKHLKLVKRDFDKVIRSMKGFITGFKTSKIMFKLAGTDIEANNSDNVEKFRKLTKQIFWSSSAFYNYNFTLFLEYAKVRSKIAKYILQASVGKIIGGTGTTNAPDNKTGSKYVDNHVEGVSMEFEIFRTVPSTSIKWSNDKGWKTAITTCNSEEKTIVVQGSAILMTAEVRRYFQFLKEFRQKGEVLSQMKFTMNLARMSDTDYLKYRKKDTHMQFYKQMQEMFKIDFDISKFTTLLKFELGATSFSITFVAAVERHLYDPAIDTLYHTSQKPIRSLEKYHRNIYLFSEPRTYFGMNKAMMPNGIMRPDLLKQANLYVYKMINIPKQYIYRDPEFSVSGARDKQTLAGIIVGSGEIEVEDITSLFYCQNEMYNRD